ncbi:MAG: transposase [Desulfobacterium sp.]|nr:transposase [Desulfobacterium sp.]MBU3948208.1 transposase [Pseudomonadota bacterium]MBU4010018.1 transposase [Pseudomonadota bacterium]MBU4035556.1 transposase [Pseudomonadota bacterium]
MTRKARIDAPGALHHIIVRGIERTNIFRTDFDRNDFLKRLGKLVTETKSRCFAWALLSNHFHLLVKTGNVPVATLMRRLLTGYAVSFNRRYKRSGHLFQNRYKSILCQEDSYLLELVRYIHLNPLRAKLVDNIQALDYYPYSGHSSIMAKVSRQWQDVSGVLELFGNKTATARRRYKAFVDKGVLKGKRHDLIGGGLIRSSGGWEAVKAKRKAKLFEKSDERILGNGDFVETVLAESNEQMKHKYHLRSKGVDLDTVADRVSELTCIDKSQIFLPGKEQNRVKARSLYCYFAVRELGVSMSELSRKMGFSVAGISLSVKRGERIAVEAGYCLVDA